MPSVWTVCRASGPYSTWTIQALVWRRVSSDGSVVDFRGGGRAFFDPLESASGGRRIRPPILFIFTAPVLRTKQLSVLPRRSGRCSFAAAVCHETTALVQVFFYRSAHVSDAVDRCVTNRSGPALCGHATDQRLCIISRHVHRGEYAPPQSCLIHIIAGIERLAIFLSA